MLRFFILPLFLFGPVVLMQAQHQRDYTEIDQWVSKLELTDTSIVSFAKELTSTASSDFEKIRAIYRFVTRHVSYEDDVPESGNKRINRSLHDILKRKKGICWDYSLLIAEMSKIAGLECKIVSGWGRDITEKAKISIEPNHAWNIVLLDSNYYLLDATWSSNTTENLDAFQQKYGTGYFLTPPHFFIVNHFPALPIFQLLDPPVSFSEWIENPSPQLPTYALPHSTRDRISSFFTKAKLEQRIIEAEAAFEIRPGLKNQAALGHTLFDQAIAIKDSADLQMEINNTAHAIARYQQALTFFDRANLLANSYPWQKEAQAFCHLNYAQVIYRMNYDKGPRHLAPVAKELKSGRALLNQLDTTNFMIQSALSQIERQLQVIE